MNAAWRFAIMFAFLTASPVLAQEVTQQGTTSTLKAGNAPTGVSFTSAKALKLPVASAYSDQRSRDDIVRAWSSQPALAQDRGAAAGAVGSGEENESNLGQPPKGESSAGNQAVGTSGLPFTSARADYETV